MVRKETKVVLKLSINLKSKRLTERRNAYRDLGKALENPETVEDINNNNLSFKPTIWGLLVQRTFAFLKQETKLYRKKKVFDKCLNNEIGFLLCRLIDSSYVKGSIISGCLWRGKTIVTLFSFLISEAQHLAMTREFKVFNGYVDCLISAFQSERYVLSYLSLEKSKLAWKLIEDMFKRSKILKNLRAIHFGELFRSYLTSLSCVFSSQAVELYILGIVDEWFEDTVSRESCFIDFNTVLVSSMSKYVSVHSYSKASQYRAYFHNITRYCRNISYERQTLKLVQFLRQVVNASLAYSQFFEVLESVVLYVEDIQLIEPVTLFKQMMHWKISSNNTEGYIEYIKLLVDIYLILHAFDPKLVKAFEDISLNILLRRSIQYNSIYPSKRAFYLHFYFYLLTSKNLLLSRYFKLSEEFLFPEILKVVTFSLENFTYSKELFNYSKKNIAPNDLPKHDFFWCCFILRSLAIRIVNRNYKVEFKDKLFAVVRLITGKIWDQIFLAQNIIQLHKQLTVYEMYTLPCILESLQVIMSFFVVNFFNRQEANYIIEKLLDQKVIKFVLNNTVESAFEIIPWIQVLTICLLRGQLLLSLDGNETQATNLRERLGKFFVKRLVNTKLIANSQTREFIMSSFPIILGFEKKTSFSFESTTLFFGVETRIKLDAFGPLDKNFVSETTCQELLPQLDACIKKILQVLSLSSIAGKLDCLHALVSLKLAISSKYEKHVDDALRHSFTVFFKTMKTENVQSIELYQLKKRHPKRIFSFLHILFKLDKNAPKLLLNLDEVIDDTMFSPSSNDSEHSTQSKIENLSNSFDEQFETKFTSTIMSTESSKTTKGELSEPSETHDVFVLDWISMIPIYQSVEFTPSLSEIFGTLCCFSSEHVIVDFCKYLKNLYNTESVDKLNILELLSIFVCAIDRTKFHSMPDLAAIFQFIESFLESSHMRMYLLDPVITIIENLVNLLVSKNHWEEAINRSITKIVSQFLTTECDRVIIVEKSSLCYDGDIFETSVSWPVQVRRKICAVILKLFPTVNIKKWNRVSYDSLQDSDYEIRTMCLTNLRYTSKMTIKQVFGITFSSTIASIVMHTVEVELYISPLKEFNFNSDADNFFLFDELLINVYIFLKVALKLAFFNNKLLGDFIFYFIFLTRGLHIYTNSVHVQDSEAYLLEGILCFYANMCSKVLENISCTLATSNADVLIFCKILNVSSRLAKIRFSADMPNIIMKLFSLSDNLKQIGFRFMSRIFKSSYFQQLFIEMISDLTDIESHALSDKLLTATSLTNPELLFYESLVDKSYLKSMKLKKMKPASSFNTLITLSLLLESVRYFNAFPSVLTKLDVFENKCMQDSFVEVTLNDKNLLSTLRLFTVFAPNITVILEIVEFVFFKYCDENQDIVNESILFMLDLVVKCPDKQVEMKTIDKILCKIGEHLTSHINFFESCLLVMVPFVLSVCFKEPRLEDTFLVWKSTISKLKKHQKWFLLNDVHFLCTKPQKEIEKLKVCLDTPILIWIIAVCDTTINGMFRSYGDVGIYLLEASLRLLLICADTDFIKTGSVPRANRSICLLYEIESNLPDSTKLRDRVLLCAAKLSYKFGYSRKAQIQLRLSADERIQIFGVNCWKQYNFTFASILSICKVRSLCGFSVSLQMLQARQELQDLIDNEMLKSDTEPDIFINYTNAALPKSYEFCLVRSSYDVWLTKVLTKFSKLQSVPDMRKLTKSTLSLDQDIKERFLLQILKNIYLSARISWLSGFLNHLISNTIDNLELQNVFGKFLFKFLHLTREINIYKWKLGTPEGCKKHAPEYLSLQLHVNPDQLLAYGEQIQDYYSVIFLAELEQNQISSSVNLKRKHAAALAPDSFESSKKLRISLLKSLRSINCDDAFGIVPDTSIAGQIETNLHRKDYYAALFTWRIAEENIIESECSETVLQQVLLTDTKRKYMQSVIYDIAVGFNLHEFQSFAKSKNCSQNNSIDLQKCSIVFNKEVLPLARRSLEYLIFQNDKSVEQACNIFNKEQVMEGTNYQVKHYVGMLITKLDIQQESYITKLLSLCSEFVDSALKSGSLRDAQELICSLDLLVKKKQNSDASKKYKIHLDFLKAKYFWCQDQQNTGLYLALKSVDELEHIVRQNEEINDQVLLARMLCTVGMWQSELVALDWKIIEKAYFDRAISLLSHDSVRVREVIRSSRLQLAEYYDELFIDSSEKLSSPALKKIQLNNARLDSQVRRFDNMDNFSGASSGLSLKKQVLKRKKNLEKQLENDKQQVSALENSTEYFLLKSIDYYFIALANGSKYNSDLKIVFRIFSLWFSHSSSSEISEIVERKLINTPILERQAMHITKLLPLLPQLVSRISDKNVGLSMFERVVLKLVEKICVKYPFHSLKTVLPIVNKKNNDVLFENSGGRQQKVKNILEKVLKVNDSRVRISLKTTIKAYNLFSKLALVKTTTKKKDSYKLKDFPKFYNGLKNLNISCIAIPTAKVEINWRNSSEGIEDVLLMASKPFASDKVAIAQSGRSRPKILKLNGTNGQIYKILIKGGDDLRQDFIMQQLFHLVNTLFKNAFLSRNKNINIRTYVVLPLSDTTGIIEWVKGTTSFGEYLHGPLRGDFRSSAHYRHNNEKDSLTFIQAWQAMSKAADDAKKSKNSKAKSILTGDDKQLRVYRSVCSRFAPVFRHFFYENFTDPISWYNKRQGYVVSVAATSVLGYVVGIGDRHTQNILLDTQTAEVVHIDFGYVFEQSTLLNIPERVPFRLTPDVLDGFGAAGVKGSYQACSERTMQVLRENIAVLRTICEVFIYDPLYDWQITPEKIRLKYCNKAEAQVEEDLFESMNKSTFVTYSSLDENNTIEAKRALERVIQKLKGFENPRGKVFTIPNQIRYITREATNEEYLSKMFIGWVAFV